MRFHPFRFSIRCSMITLAVATILAAGSSQALKWVRLRADYLQQVENYRLLLGDAEKSLAEAEASFADPDEQAFAARLSGDQRASFTALVDDILRSRVVLAAAIPRWQRLADHPWESVPADLYRLD